MAERILSGPDRDYSQSFIGADWGEVEDKYDPKGNFTPKPDDYHPQFEYTQEPLTTGLERESGKRTLYLEGRVADSLPFLPTTPDTTATLSETTSIGLGGKREKTIIFEGPQAGMLAQRFTTSRETITDKSLLQSTQPLQSKTVAA